MRVKHSVIAISLFIASQSALAFDDNDGVRVIIKYKQQLSSVHALKTQISNMTHLPVHDLKPMANGAYSLILDAVSLKATLLPSDDPSQKILEKLRQDPAVLYAVKDRKGYFKPVPDPIITNLSNELSHRIQWDEFTRPAGVMLESAPGLGDGAWAYTTGKADKPVVVAVLDTGIALNDSIINNLVKDKNGKVFGWNFAGNNNNLSDETGSYHGTHVSGTIAGYGDVMNGMGVDLKVLTVKIPQADGMFFESAVINGIYWAVGGEVPGVPNNPYPAKVLNMSFGVDEGPGKEIDHCDEALQDAMFFARKNGAIVAAAAGNDNVWEHYNAPAVCNSTIKVASTGPAGLRSYFSNYGPSITFAAPGGDKYYGTTGGILSTVNPGGGYQGSGFDFYQGTSMATPHVAGVAGLVIAASGKYLSPKQLEQILYTTTHDFGVSNRENDSCIGNKPCGHGILDAENAVKAVIEGYDVIFSSPKINGCSSALKTISQGTQQWTLVKASCDIKTQYQHPRIEQDKNGVIFANYEGITYQLDQSAFRSCAKIGYDGVGCFY